MKMMKQEQQIPIVTMTRAELKKHVEDLDLKEESFFDEESPVLLNHDNILVGLLARVAALEETLKPLLADHHGDDWDTASNRLRLEYHKRLAHLLVVPEGQV